MDNSVRISLLQSDAEARAVGFALEDAEIPHIVRSFHDSALDGLFQQQKGWGCVMGTEEDRARIEEVIARVRAEAEARAAEPDSEDA